MVQEVGLKVSEAFQQDVGYGRARIDHQTRIDLDLSIGDVIEIEGSKITAASVWRAHPSDEGKRIIRLDNLTRKNAGTGLGDRIKIRRAEVKEAREVTLAPLMPEGQRIEFGMGIDAIIRKNLLRRPITKSDEITVPGIAFFGNALPFVIVDTSPHGVVSINERTVLRVKEEPAKIAEEESLRISYEDIGGLQNEISKVREMIELPLKHPEVFNRLGIDPPKGVLLHGPPGTGKTLIAKAVANESGASFYTINGPEIMCVDGKTNIFTNPSGYVKAEDVFERQGTRYEEGGNTTIELNRPLSTYAFSDGKITKAKITHVTKLTAPTYKIKISDGSEIKASNNQPFLIYEAGSFIWKRVSDLKSGDYVARLNEIKTKEKSHKLQPNKIKGLVKKDGKYVIKSRNLSRSTLVKLPESTSENLLEFFGLLVSDGNISKTGDSITFSNNDNDLRDKFKFLLEQLFGITKTKEYPDGRVVVYSKTIIRFLKHAGFEYNKKLCIPPYFYMVPKKEVMAFIRGYFDGDGTVSMTGNYPTPKLFSVSKEFIQDLQALLQIKLGISSKTGEHRTPKGLVYELVIRGYEGRLKFLDIGSSTHAKRAKLEKIKEVVRIKDFHDIPHPSLLINEIKTKLPYKTYRNKDYYVYEAGNITKHALNTLYQLAENNNILNNMLKKEYQTLMRDDIGWEKIESIDFLGEQELYDFTVNKDSFIGGSYFFLHNSKFYGQSEENLRKVFDEAQKNAPSIIFLDEIDAIAPKRSEVHGEVERRVVSQLLTLMDGLKGRGKVIVIGATNIPDILDPALRRPGRFDREIRIDVPDAAGRKEILQIHTRGMPINANLDDFYLERKTDTGNIRELIIQGIKKIHVSDLLRNLSSPKDKDKRIVVGDYLTVIFSKFKEELPNQFFEKLVKILTDEIVNVLPYDIEGAELELGTEQQISERLTATAEKPDDFIKRIVKEIILDEMADITYGFVGADLAALAREAAMNALRRYLPDIDLEKPIPVEMLEKMEVLRGDFKNAHRGIEPSAIREFFIEIPKISWSDIGGLEEVKQNLIEAVEWPLTQPEVFKRMGIKAPRGILLYGPPGTGKTLLAKAVAHESKANFISIKGPEVLSKWVGESEKAIRELFKKARQVAPTIVFLDEIDSIAPRRGQYSGSHVTESVVNQILTSIDGLESMDGVVVLGATNKPDMLDPALLRPGRFDRLLLTPAPDEKSRFKIFKIHTKDIPVTLTEEESKEIDKEFEREKVDIENEQIKIIKRGVGGEVLSQSDLEKLDKKKIKSTLNIKDLSSKDKLLYLLSKKTEGYSGADIEGLCREAAMLALRDDIKANEVGKSHFEQALTDMGPSITEDLINHYKRLKQNRTRDIIKDDKRDRDVA